MHRTASSPSARRSPCRKSRSAIFPTSAPASCLARAPGFVGTYLALTGARAAAADAIYCGLADLHIPAARLDELPAALADCRGRHDVKARLDKFSSAARGRPPRRGAVLDRSLLWRGQRRGDFRTVGAIRRRRGARGARNHAQNVADLAQDHIAKHQVGAIIRAGRAELSAGLSRRRSPASPNMISSKASARPSSTRTAIRRGARIRSKASRRTSSSVTSARSARWN